MIAVRQSPRRVEWASVWHFFAILGETVSLLSVHWVYLSTSFCHCVALVGFTSWQDGSCSLAPFCSLPWKGGHEAHVTQKTSNKGKGLRLPPEVQHFISTNHRLSLDAAASFSLHGKWCFRLVLPDRLLAAFLRPYNSLKNSPSENFSVLEFIVLLSLICINFSVYQTVVRVTLLDISRGSKIIASGATETQLEKSHLEEDLLNGFVAHFWIT